MVQSNEDDEEDEEAAMWADAEAEGGGEAATAATAASAADARIDKVVTLCRRLCRQACAESVVQRMLQSIPFEWTLPEHQQRLYHALTHDDVLAKFPLSSRASTSFWRALLAQISSRPTPLIAELEAKRAEIQRVPETDAAEEDELRTDAVRAYQKPWYKTYDVVLPADPSSSSSSPSASAHMSRFPLLDPRARPLSFRVETGFSNNIGLVMWPAGYLLADFVLRRPELFRGERVLELGVGIGLTSVVLHAAAAPAALIATDFQDNVLRNIEFNFRLNGVTGGADADADGTCGAVCDVRVGNVDWTAFDEQQLASYEADVILAADTTYIPEILAPFARTVRVCLQVAQRRLGAGAAGASSPKQPVAYLAQTERHPLYFMEYLSALQDEQLEVEEIELDDDDVPQHFVYERETIHLHRVMLRAS